MSIALSVIALLGVLLWEFAETRSDFLSQRMTRVLARKSFGFWLVVIIISVVLGGFWGYLLAGPSSVEGTFFDFERPKNGLILASLFAGFGSVPALKSFKLLPIVNKVFGNISFDDTNTHERKGVMQVVRLWWSL